MSRAKANVAVRRGGYLRGMLNSAAKSFVYPDRASRLAGLYPQEPRRPRSKVGTIAPSVAFNYLEPGFDETPTGLVPSVWPRPFTAQTPGSPRTRREAAVPGKTEARPPSPPEPYPWPDTGPDAVDGSGIDTRYGEEPPGDTPRASRAMPVPSHHRRMPDARLERRSPDQTQFASVPDHPLAQGGSSPNRGSVAAAADPGEARTPPMQERPDSDPAGPAQGGPTPGDVTRRGAARSATSTDSTPGPRTRSPDTNTAPSAPRPLTPSTAGFAHIATQGTAKQAPGHTAAGTASRHGMKPEPSVEAARHDRSGIGPASPRGTGTSEQTLFPSFSPRVASRGHGSESASRGGAERRAPQHNTVHNHVTVVSSTSSARRGNRGCWQRRYVGRSFFKRIR